MEELFYRYNPWWEEIPLFAGLIERPLIAEQLKKHLTSKQIVFLTGLRRVGKTTLLKLMIKDLIVRDHIDAKHIFYISLDDYMLAKKSLTEIIDIYRKIHKLSYQEKVFLFLDEVAFQRDFEVQLKNLHDAQNVKIYASSSSASVLRNKKSYLTGRQVILEVLPLDFREYLDFKKIHVGRGNQHLIGTYFEDYMKTGGIPDYVLRGDIDYLRELVDDILYKDIASLYKIKNPQVLRDFFLLLMERSGKIISINKIARILDISPDTAKRYLHFFEETFLIYLLPRCGKTNERLLAPKKIYAADLGIRTLFTGFRDKGSLFENYVYLKIKHRQPCYVYKNGLEFDFSIADKILIEVKYGREMDVKQEALFKKLKNTKKFFIRSLEDLENIENEFI